MTMTRCPASVPSTGEWLVPWEAEGLGGVGMLVAMHVPFLKIWSLLSPRPHRDYQSGGSGWVSLSLFSPK